VTVPEKRKSARLLDLKLPATSANLGPAFDAAALAMDIYLRVEAVSADKFSIIAQGRDTGICESLKNNLIVETYREVLRAAGKQPQPVHLHIRNEIPIGKGCGSSAAARLAGIALAVRVGKLGWDDNRIIEEASRREGHPDNSAACWLGGVVVARMGTGPASKLEAARINPAKSWPLLLAIADQPFSTEKARRVLPQQYPRADAVANVQNAMLLLAGLVQGSNELLAATLNDRIHEPYRGPLCSLLPVLRELAPRDGILGVALSGAGPSVLMFLNTRSSAEKIKKLVAAHLRKRNLSAELLLTSISDHGATQSFRSAALSERS